MKALLAIAALTFAIPSVSLLSQVEVAQAQTFPVYNFSEAYLDELIARRRTRLNTPSPTEFVIGYRFTLRSPSGRTVNARVINSLVDATGQRYAIIERF